MKKLIYYVVEKELQNSNYAGEEDAVEETTGNKNVAVYTVVDGKIKSLVNFDLLIRDNTLEEIIDYLVQEGHAEDSRDVSYSSYYKEFEFIQL